MKTKQKNFNTVLNIFKATSVSFVLVVLFLGFVTPVLAQNLQTGIEYGTFTGLGTQDIRISIMKVVRVFLGFVGIIALILVLYGGWIWMSSAGRPDRIEQAKSILRNAAIGLLIILLAFSIVSFIIGLLQEAIFGDGGRGGGRPPSGGCENCGHLGSGIIESVYPAPFSKDNPRNTNIMVTFKVVMDASTIIDSPSLPPSCSFATPCVGTMLDNSVTIFPDDNPADAIDPARVSVRSVDGETFVFDPQDYLGNTNSNVWYSVQLNSDIEKDNGETAFPGAGGVFLWRFEIGTFLDIDPVEAKDVFPQPDDASDSYSFSAAIQASGSIDVSTQPDFAQGSATQNLTAIVGNPANLTGIYNCAEDTTICVNAVNTADFTINPKTLGSDCSAPNITVGGLASAASIGGGSSIALGCGLTMTLDTPQSGNQWSFDALAQRSADTLRVGNTTYTFVDSGATGNEINIGVTPNDTAQNISSALAGNSQVIVTSVAGSTVNLQATLAGPAGNNINLISSGSWSSIAPMVGGQDQVLLPSTVDVPDQPRNAIIVINFSEAIDPTLVNASTISIEYFDGSVWQGVAGSYFVSNQFQTVEFISDSVCVDSGGNPIANSCGDPMFCLPVISPSPSPYLATEYRVQINAGVLNTCSSSADCVDPNFNVCSSSQICEGTFGSINAFNPEVSITPNGITDAANNTFNGNENTYTFNFQKFGDAEGPQSQSSQPPYNLNLPDSNLGDDMTWSFFVNENIDLSPPVIESIAPNINFSGVSLKDPVEATFEELIMSKSLKSGTGYRDGLCGGCTSDSQCSVSDGEICDLNTNKCVDADGEQNFCAQDAECGTGLCINKKYVTLIDLSTRKVGWWVTKDGLDTVLPFDGYPDQDKANIEHTTFPIVTNYGAEFGSGIQDVYQNCYIPSEGPDGFGGNCNTTDIEPYCCSGVAMDQSTWQSSTCFTGF